MNINRFTEKAQQAILQAQEMASQYSHSEIEPEHILLALVRQADGVVPRVLSKMGIAPRLRRLRGGRPAHRGRAPPALQEFRPEFLNRVDEVIIFHSLSREQIVQIVDIQLRRLQSLLADRRINLEVTEVAKQYLAEVGYDPVYGARPLKRAIQRELQDPLALQLLQGRFKEGDTVRVDVGDGQLTFSRAELVAVQA